MALRGSALGAVDDGASMLIAQAPGDWFDRVDAAIDAGNGVPLWCALALLVAGAGRRGRCASASGLVAAVAGSVVSNTVKPFIGRPRPWTLARGRRRRTAALPSSHVTTGAAFATAAAGELQSSLLVTVPVVAVVAFSRVHSRQHRTADVSAGAAFGIITGAGIHGAIRLARRLRP